MIRQHAGDHGFANRHGANADARIVAALGHDIGVGALFLLSTVRARRQNRRAWLHRETDHHRLPRGDSAEDAARVVRQNPARPLLPMVSRWRSPCRARRRGETVADLDALDGVDRHHRPGEVAVELGVDRGAEAGRHAFRDDLDHRPDGGPLLPQSSSSSSHPPRLRVRTQEWVAELTSSQSQLARSTLCGPICTSAPRTVMPGKILRAMAPAATRIAVSRAEERPPPRKSRRPYLGFIGVVGVAGTKLVS